MIEVADVPKVSVLMCVFNGARFVQKAIDSILEQNYTEFEFIIIDDCSVDATSEIIASYNDPRIRLITNTENKGLTKSLNIGLKQCCGQYIARQDADDISHPCRLKSQVEFLDEHPDVVLLGTQYRVIDEFGNVYKRRGEYKATGHSAILYQLLFGNPFIHSAVMFRSDIIVKEHGGYNETFRYNQDFELWSRVIKTGKVANLPELLVDFRNNPDSITKPSAEKQEAFEQNFKRNIEIQKSNLANLVGQKVLNDWPVHWSLLNVPYIAGNKSFRTAIRQLEQLRKVFIATQNVTHPTEINSLTADAFFRIAMIAASSDIPAALTAYRKGVMLNAAGMRRLPELLVRLAGLPKLGKSVRKLANHISLFKKVKAS